MKKRNVLTAAVFITSALVSQATADSPALKQFNSWHGTKASISYEAKHATPFDGYGTNLYGSDFSIKSGNTNSDGVTPDRWYEISSAGSNGLDTKLFYQNNNGQWIILSDDIDYPSNKNFRAVIYMPTKNRRFPTTVQLQASYHNSNATDNYWGEAIQHLEDPQLNVPYLIVEADGTLRIR